jgi:hypothetical protein
VSAAFKVVLLFLSLIMMASMSKGQCVVDTFKIVFASKHYKAQWIPDHFVADAIHHD